MQESEDTLGDLPLDQALLDYIDLDSLFPTTAGLLPKPHSTSLTNTPQLTMFRHASGFEPVFHRHEQGEFKPTAFSIADAFSEGQVEIKIEPSFGTGVGESGSFWQNECGDLVSSVLLQNIPPPQRTHEMEQPSPKRFKQDALGIHDFHPMTMQDCVQTSLQDTVSFTVTTSPIEVPSTHHWTRITYLVP